MDLVTYALCKKIAAGAVSGISDLTVDGTNLVITTSSGDVLTMSFPTPQDGISIVDVYIDDDGSLLCKMSDGVVIDAGTVPSVKGDPGYTPVKGIDYFTQDEIDAIIEQAQSPMELEII